MLPFLVNKDVDINIQIIVNVLLHHGAQLT